MSLWKKRVRPVSANGPARAEAYSDFLDRKVLDADRAFLRRRLQWTIAICE
jgi:hypothetical protein